MQTLDWDDLRFAHAVASAGSLAAGARQLGVNHTTVMRRIASLESRLGVRLFERLPSGYALTPRGEELVEAARAIGETVVALERRLQGADLAVSGPVRITTTDTLMASLLPAIVLGLKATHPALQIEITCTNQFLNLSKREADVAIRPADDPPPGLFGRRIASVGFAVYGARALRLDQAPAMSELAQLPWIAPDDSLLATKAGRWMRSALPDVAIAARADSFVAIRALAEAGLGVATLPCYLGDIAPGLRRLSAPIAAMQSGLWILTHEDLRRSARIRAFMEFAGAALGKQRRLIEGA